MEIVFVKVAVIPGESKDISLEAGSTVQAAIEAAGFDTDMGGKTLQVNATAATLSQTVNNGDVVAIAKGAKGNS